MFDEQAREKLAAAAQRRLARLPAAAPRSPEARLARIRAADKRERERFETRVLGNAPQTAAPRIGSKPHGMSKSEWKVEKQRRRSASMPAPTLAAKWSHKAGTPETLEHALGTHTDSIAQLERNGTITKEQSEWVAQIANVHRSIEAGVGVKVASLEGRVDQSARPPVVAERIHRVRMHRAYTVWREMLPAPKALVLDMTVGDTIGYTVAARRHRVHNRKAKRLLIEAILRWPVCVAHAFSAVDQSAVDAMNEARDPGVAAAWRAHPAAAISPPRSYDAARDAESWREKTDEPYLLPPVDGAFLDERGLLRPWAEIADIVRERSNALPDIADPQ